jgi:hypothetical protein
MQKRHGAITGLPSRTLWAPATVGATLVRFKIASPSAGATDVMIPTALPAAPVFPQAGRPAAPVYDARINAERTTAPEQPKPHWRSFASVKKV